MSTTTTLILGLILNAVTLPFAAKRIVFLVRLITGGKPAPDRIAGVTGRVSQAIKGQLVEVLGQKKLLKWSIPGIAHAFVMYAFLILGTVYVEAYGILLSTNPDDVKLIETYEAALKAQGTDLDIQLVDLPSSGYADKLSAMLLSGDIPDLIYFQGGDAKMAEQGILEDWNNWLPKTTYLKDALFPHNVERL